MRAYQSHGLTGKEADRLRAEYGGCWLCGSTRSLVIDHDHVSGVIRGVLCNQHNLLLGILNDDTDLLARMIEYLEHPPIGKTVEEMSS